MVAKADVGRLGLRLGAGGREIVCECGAAASSGRGAGRWVILGGLSAAARRCGSRRLCAGGGGGFGVNFGLGVDCEG